MLLRRFIKFLKEEKAYVSYRKMLINQPNTNMVKNMFYGKKIENKNISQVGCLILGAFTWSESIEGAGYWLELYKKWCDIEECRYYV